MSGRFVVVDDVGAVVREHQRALDKWRQSGDPKDKEAWLGASRQLSENTEWVVLCILQLQGDLDRARDNLKLIRDSGMSANDARDVARRTLEDLIHTTY